MAEVTDDRGVRVRLERPPARVVSLVPSVTETLFDLGLAHAVVGVTRFCVRPEAARALPKVGGTKDVDPARVAALAPDLILANCEENTREVLDALAPVAPVHAAFPRTVDAALADLLRLGRLLHAAPAAARWHARATAARARLHAAAAGRPRRRAACLIWRRPWMATGADTFTHHLLDEAGLDDVFADRPERFPAFEPAELAARAPEVVLLTSEPFPFRPRHADELAAASGLPRARFRFIDGQDLTWHGTRLARALAHLADAADGPGAEVPA